MKRQRTFTEGEDSDAVDTVRRCFDAYGADLSKWPRDARERWSALASSDACAALREDAALLDGFLNAATAPAPSADLRNRIEARFVRPRARGGASALWPFLRPAPAGALAALGALGFIAGAATSSSQAALAPEIEALGYIEAAATALDDEEADLWAVD